MRIHGLLLDRWLVLSGSVREVAVLYVRVTRKFVSICSTGGRRLRVNLACCILRFSQICCVVEKQRLRRIVFVVVTGCFSVG